MTLRRFLVLALVFVLAAAPAPRGSKYLIVWAMETADPSQNAAVGGMEMGMGSGRDFLAVFDVAPDSAEFGKLIIDFTRKWPDGWNGPAMPHGAIFSN